MITPARLDTFLKVMEQQYPEEWASGKGPLYWYIDYKVSYPPFQFHIEFNEEMLYVQYVFPDFRIRFSCYLALYSVLLRLNEELSLVKFGLTQYGNIALLGEIPAAQFSLDTFQSLLRLMVHYLEQLYWEIGIVAESPELALFLTGQEASMAELDRKFTDIVKRIHVEDITGQGAEAHDAAGAS
jgi:hypothetical protein